MRELGVVVAGIAIAFAWLTIWAGFLHIFDLSPFRRKMTDRDVRRERLKALGKLRYILMFGVLGPDLRSGWQRRPRIS